MEEIRANFQLMSFFPPLIKTGRPVTKDLRFQGKSVFGIYDKLECNRWCNDSAKWIRMISLLKPFHFNSEVTLLTSITPALFTMINV